MRWLTPLLAATSLGVSLIVLSQVAAEPNPRQQLRDALAQQQDWLADQPVAPGWDKYLRTAELQDQLNKNSTPDRAVVKEILNRYEARQPGLRLPLFASTRNALVAWLNDLVQPRLAELPAILRAAKGT